MKIPLLSFKLIIDILISKYPKHYGLLVLSFEKIEFVEKYNKKTLFSKTFDSIKSLENFFTSHSSPPLYLILKMGKFHFFSLKSLPFWKKISFVSHIRKGEFKAKRWSCVQKISKDKRLIAGVPPNDFLNKVFFLIEKLEVPIISIDLWPLLLKERLFLSCNNEILKKPWFFVLSCKENFTDLELSVFYQETILLYRYGFCESFDEKIIEKELTDTIKYLQKFVSFDKSKALIIAPNCSRAIPLNLNIPIQYLDNDYFDPFCKNLRKRKSLDFFKKRKKSIIPEVLALSRLAYKLPFFLIGIIIFLMISFFSFHIFNYIEKVPSYNNEQSFAQKISSLLLDKGYVATRPLLMALGICNLSEFQIEEIQWERLENSAISCWITFMNPKNHKEEEFLMFIKNLKKIFLNLETRWEGKPQRLYLSYRS